jgi:DNA-nicking Smr family endonuclease
MNDDKARPGRRKLTVEDEHLWSAVARTIKPLRTSRRATSLAKHKAGAPARARTADSKAVAAATSRPAVAPVPPASIARREKQQLARGRVAIDARIDLHGMTLAQAHGTLLRFLHRAQADGARFALVITGKGAPNASRGRSRCGSCCRIFGLTCSALTSPMWDTVVKARSMCACENRAGETAELVFAAICRFQSRLVAL